MSGYKANTDEPNKTTGQYHSLKGNLVETIGDLSGSQAWKESGRQEHVEGEAEYNAAQAKNYVEGAADRLAGKKDAIVGAINNVFTGNVRHDKGQAQQELNKPSV